MTTESRPGSAIRAVLWDFGGVFTESPFLAFAGFERARGLPENFLRRVNSTNPDQNAWARFERGELTLTQFDSAFGDESAALGHRVAGGEVIELLYGEIRPQMVQALRRCRDHFVNACLTNNVRAAPGHGPLVSDARAEQVAEILSLFHLVVESSKVGTRKPEVRFYRLALEQLGIEPQQAVYLDDLGINLKPARALGMATIKVESSEQALAELERVLGVTLTGA